MSHRNVLILERSSQNLQKISKDGKTVLEGVFAEFGIENRNGRIYEEKEYLPHLQYLKADITRGNLLGELDHPERFEVALGSVSHRIIDLWYDQQSRQIKGRLEVLEGTPKGQIAKALLEAGVPLSISSRAAGTVNENKTVSIQQIYTYDLVAKPGFEAAQLKSVNEGAVSNINKMIEVLNESSTFRNEHNINSKLGLVNENISVMDLSDKYPVLKLRKEAIEINKNKVNEHMNYKKTEVMNEDTAQRWTELFRSELGAINERLDRIERSGNRSGNSTELRAIKKYIEKMRKIQENSLNWQSEIAKAVNEVANYADTLSHKSNKHYRLTRKIVETVDHNAKTLNASNKWTGSIAETTNAIGKTVDHNAKMLNSMNEWTERIATSINKLNEWGAEKARAINAIHEWVSENAKAVNGMHEWTSSIAKNLNHTVNWSEDMFGRAISKDDASKLIEYAEIVAESKRSPKLKAKLNEMLNTHSITAKPLNESTLKGIKVIDSVGKIGNSKVDTRYDRSTGVEFDDKTKTIISKLRNIRVNKTALPKGLNNKLQMGGNMKPERIRNSGLDNDPRHLKNKLKRTRSINVSDKERNMKVDLSAEKLKLDTKPTGKPLPYSKGQVTSIKNRKTNLDEKLSRIINTLEKEKSISERVKTQYPFTQLLSESDRKRFNALDATDKLKVAREIEKNPTVDSKVIVKLWESVLSGKDSSVPLWLKLAPKAYREAYEKAPQLVKESINAKSEFFTLNTQYQIENFWETSGIISKPVYNLNESVSATKSGESNQKYDSVVASVAEQMKRYNY